MTSLVIKKNGLDALKQQLAGDRDCEESLVLLLDKSPSMRELELTGVRKLDAMKHAALELVHSCSNKSHIGVVAFNIIAERMCHIQRSRFVIEKAIRDITIGDDTLLFESLGMSYQMLKLSPSRVSRIILMTDGIVRDSEQALALIDKRAKLAIIDCVAFGADADVDFLRRIAAMTGGVVRTANTAQELVHEFKQLEVNIRGLLT